MAFSFFTPKVVGEAVHLTVPVVSLINQAKSAADLLDQCYDKDKFAVVNRMHKLSDLLDRLACLVNERSALLSAHGELLLARYCDVGQKTINLLVLDPVKLDQTLDEGDGDLSSSAHYSTHTDLFDTEGKDDDRTQSIDFLSSMLAFVETRLNLLYAVLHAASELTDRRNETGLEGSPTAAEVESVMKSAWGSMEDFTALNASWRSLCEAAQAAEGEKGFAQPTMQFFVDHKIDPASLHLSDEISIKLNPASTALTTTKPGELDSGPGGFWHLATCYTKIPPHGILDIDALLRGDNPTKFVPAVNYQGVDLEGFFSKHEKFLPFLPAKKKGKSKPAKKPTRVYSPCASTTASSFSTFKPSWQTRNRRNRRLSISRSPSPFRSRARARSRSRSRSRPRSRSVSTVSTFVPRRRRSRSRTRSLSPSDSERDQRPRRSRRARSVSTEIIIDRPRDRSIDIVGPPLPVLPTWSSPLGHWAPKIFQGHSHTQIPTTQKTPHPSVCHHQWSIETPPPPSYAGWQRVLTYQPTGTFALQFYHHELDRTSVLAISKTKIGLPTTAVSLDLLKVSSKGTKLKISGVPNKSPNSLDTAAPPLPWLTLTIPTIEDHIILARAIAAMRAQDTREHIHRTPEPHFRAEEVELFRKPVTYYNDHQDTLRVLKDVPTGVVRLECTDLGSEYKDVPLWTSFITYFLLDREWCERKGKDVVFRQLPKQWFNFHFEDIETCVLRFNDEGSAADFVDVLGTLRDERLGRQVDGEDDWTEVGEEIEVGARKVVHGRLPIR